MNEHEEYVSQYAKTQAQYGEDSDCKGIKFTPGFFQRDTCRYHCSYEKRQTSVIESREERENAGSNTQKDA